MKKSKKQKVIKTKTPPSKEPERPKNIADIADDLDLMVKNSQILQKLATESERIVVDPLNIIYRTKQLEIMLAFIGKKNHTTFLLLIFPWSETHAGVTQEYVDKKLDRAARILRVVNESGEIDSHAGDMSMVLKI